MIDGFKLSGDEADGRELFGGYFYTGAFYVSALGAGTIAEGLHEERSAMPGVAASASAVTDGLYRALNLCRFAARSYLGLPPPSRPMW